MERLYWIILRVSLTNNKDVKQIFKELGKWIVKIYLHAQCRNWKINQKPQRNIQFSSVKSSSVTQSCPTLCDPMNHSTPGLPVHHHLPEFTQTHVHRVRDAIQPSHPLLSPFILPSIPPSIRVYTSESTLCMRWPKYWSFSFSIILSKEHPGLISFIYLFILFFYF